MSYSEQYKDPRWQKRRLQMLEAAGWECENCHDSESTLNVHHSYYVSGRTVWDYPNWALNVLCETCHKEIHAQEAEDSRLRDEVRNDNSGYSEWEDILQFLKIDHPMNSAWSLTREVAFLANLLGVQCQADIFQRLKLEVDEERKRTIGAEEHA